MTCLSTIKFSMVATVVRNYKNNVVDPVTLGYNREVYDELTGESKTVWVATDLIPEDGVDHKSMEVPCLVSPNYTVSQDNDIKYQRTKVLDTERLTMKCPSRYRLFTTDRIIAIRNRTNELIFADDQIPDPITPAIYNVVGVLPVVDPFGRTMEYQVALEKANAQ
jgi:hypothetical protein